MEPCLDMGWDGECKVKLDPTKRYRFQLFDVSDGLRRKIFDTVIAAGENFDFPPIEVTTVECTFTVIGER